jgi:acetyl-CoA carboxylase biotin carboxyl carrier protein
MQTQDIRQLAEWLAATDIDVLELRGPGVQVTIHRDGAATAGTETAAPPAEASPTANDQAPVRSPSPGVLLDRIPGRAAPLCAPGAAVQTGSLLALLQIGPLLLPVPAPCDGWAGHWLVAPGSTVGYGTHLLNIDTGMDTEPAAARP